MTDKEKDKKPDPEQATPEPEETRADGEQPEEQAEPAEAAAGEGTEPTETAEPAEPAESAGAGDDSARRIARLEEQLAAVQNALEHSRRTLAFYEIAAKTGSEETAKDLYLARYGEENG